MKEKSDERQNMRKKDYSRYESYQTEDSGYVIYDGKDPKRYIKISETDLLVDVEGNR